MSTIDPNTGNVPHRCRHRVGGGGSGGLGIPVEVPAEGLVFGDSYVPFVAAKRKNHREGFKLGDVVTCVGIYKRTIPEGIILGDAPTSKLQADLTEGLVLGDSVAGVFAGVRVPDEGLVLGDSVAETTPKLVGKTLEGLVFGDILAPKATLKASLTEGLVLGDSASPDATFRQGEGLVFGDSYTSTQRKQLFEVMRFGDSYTTKAGGIGLTEGLRFGDSYNPKTSVTLTEGITFGDLTKRITHVEMTEGLIWRDDLGHLIITPVVEGVVIGESYQNKLQVQLTEGFTISDEPTDGTKVFEAALTEGLVLAGPAAADFNAVEHDEGIKFGDTYSRFPPNPAFWGDSFARNVGSITGCVGACDIHDLGESDGDGLDESEVDLVISDFEDQTLDGWIYTGGVSGGIQGPGTGYNSDYNVRLFSSINDEIKKNIVLPSDCTGGTLRYWVRCTQVFTPPATLEVRVGGTLVRTISKSATSSYEQFTDTFSNVGSVEFKFTNPQEGTFRIDDIEVEQNIPYKNIPMPYRLEGKGSDGTLVNSSSELQMNGRAGNGNQTMRVYWDQLGADSGDPGIELFDDHIWIFLHVITGLTQTAGGAGFALSESVTGANSKYWGIAGNSKIVGSWTIGGFYGLVGVPSFTKAIPFTDPLSTNLKMYAHIPPSGTPRFRVESGSDIHTMSGWGLNVGDWKNFGLVHKGDQATSGFKNWFIVKGNRRPIGFPNI